MNLYLFLINQFSILFGQLLWLYAQPSPCKTYSQIFHNYYYIRRYNYYFFVHVFFCFVSSTAAATIRHDWFVCWQRKRAYALRNEQKSKTNGCIELKLLFNLSCSNDIEISILHNLNIFESFCIFLISSPIRSNGSLEIRVYLRRDNFYPWMDAVCGMSYAVCERTCTVWSLALKIEIKDKEVLYV